MHSMAQEENMLDNYIMFCYLFNYGKKIT